MKFLPSYEELRSTGKRIRLHPNGFIQLDLQEDGKKRLHVWPQRSELPVSNVRRDPIHDHIFRFESTVILGVLGHLVYEAIPHKYGPYNIYLVSPFVAAKTESPLELQDDTRYQAHLVERKLMEAGTEYSFEAFKFHDSVPMTATGLTATIVTIGEFDPKAKARVLRRRRMCQSSRANIFRRDCVNSEILWDFVKRVCVATA